MARIFGAIVFATFLALPITLAAQGRGGFHGGHGGGGAGRVAPAPVAPFAGRGSSAFVGHGLPPVVAGPPVSVFRAPLSPVVRPHRTVIVPQPFGFYSPYFWSSPFYTSPFYSGYSEPAYVTNPNPVVQSSVVGPNDVELSYQVQRLSQEIEQLRADESARLSAQVQQQPQPPPIPTILVFRDGHRLEIQNYAIVGQTLWVLEEKTSTKISVADLDLDATQKENRARGVRFPLSGQ